MNWTRVIVTARYDSHLSPLADVDCPVSRARGRLHGRPRWIFQPDTDAQRQALERALAGVAAPRGPARVHYVDGPRLPLIGVDPESAAEGWSLPTGRLEQAPEEGIGPAMAWSDDHALPPMSSRAILEAMPEPEPGTWAHKLYSPSEENEMARGPSFQRKVVEATSEAAYGGINKWTLKLEDGHTVIRHLIRSAKAPTKAGCDVCKTGAR